MPDTPHHSFHPPFRQVHLDFHTHGAIQNVGAEFDPESFASTLERAKVESITCFARCHHGWMYYDSQRFPERIHPHLVRRNLLLEQIEACHKRGIRVPVYTTVQWDAFTAKAHPEWLSEESPYTSGLYPPLCLNTPYRDFLQAHLQELIETLPLDGLYLDNMTLVDCSCAACRAGMEAEAGDPSEQEVRLEYARRVLKAFVEETIRSVRAQRPDLNLTFSPIGNISFRDYQVSITHIETDADPTAGAGTYLSFPLAARHYRAAGGGCVGKISRFHDAMYGWCGIDGYKNQSTLEYECFQSLSLGCQVIIADRMPPSGRLDTEAYKRIGGVFSQIELKEPWCRQAKAVTDIGVLKTDPFAEYIYDLNPEKGLFQILEESAQQFDILDPSMDFSRYRVLILPDRITVEDTLKQKLNDYLGQGGALLASFESGMNAEKSRFTLDSLGVEYIGPEPMMPDGRPAQGTPNQYNDFMDYLLPQGGIGKGLSETEPVLYYSGVSVKAIKGSEILAERVLIGFDNPYLNRNQQIRSPSFRQSGFAGIVRKDRAIYFAHPIFSLYHWYAPLWIKRLFLNALEMLLPSPLLRHDGPTTLRATLLEQTDQNRWIVHLLHYIPQQRSDVEVIEDIIPLNEIKVSVRIPRTVRCVQLRPQHHIPLDFWQEGEYLEFVVPRLEGHQMIAIEFV